MTIADKATADWIASVCAVVGGLVGFVIGIILVKLKMIKAEDLKLE